jgi:hypothetical protein
VLEVKDWGKIVRVLINGGQSMTNSIPQVAQYLDSIERTHAMATVADVEGVMTPHIYWDGEGAKLNEINATGTNPSQHVYGHQNVLRQLAVAPRVFCGLVGRGSIPRSCCRSGASTRSSSWAETRRPPGSRRS